MSTHKKRRPIVNNCEHATFLIEKRKYTSISVEDEQTLHIHLEGCTECRLYDRQSKLIDLITQQLSSYESSEKKLNADFKEQLQQEINQKINQGHPPDKNL